MRRIPNIPVESAGNALLLLSMLCDKPLIRVSEAADLLGVARSTAHRSLATLVRLGFLVQDAETRGYRAGTALSHVGRIAYVEERLRTAAEPLLPSLSDAYGVAAHVSALRGSNVAYLSCTATARAQRAFNRVGTVFPAYASSAGKALLAELGPDAVRMRFPLETFRRFTHRTISTRSGLLTELARVCERGYATNFGESEVGMAAISCTIRDSAGKIVGAASLGGSEGHFRRVNLSTMTEALAEVCAAASRRLDEIAP